MGHFTGLQESYDEGVGYMTAVSLLERVDTCVLWRLSVILIPSSEVVTTETWEEST